MSAIHCKAKENDIVLNLKDLNLGGSEEVEKGQEADVELLDLPTLINRTADNKSNEEDSSGATLDGSLLSSAQEMSNEDDCSSMLIDDNFSNDGSDTDLNNERDRLVSEMYAHTQAWNTQRNYVKKGCRRQKMM